ncbi:unnamed protein product [Ranitomeya imitator]|uniref:ribonuclease H n=1 Tax=Ranitomeya imitator TaxID=111125 RepID=A0ABN9M3W2_9NEOB|nr:unnamed protein product [Ranitomeya imitator]
MRDLDRMGAAIDAIPFAQFRFRPLQLAILKSWDKNPFSLDREFRLTSSTKRSLHWWLKPTSLAKGKSFLTGQWKVLTTDASLTGWGAVHLHHRAQGKWFPVEATMPINILEIRAILLALRAFRHLLAASHIRIQLDNATAVAYVNHQGGTRSTQAMREVSHILHWAEDTGSVLSTVHIPEAKREILRYEMLQDNVEGYRREITTLQEKSQKLSATTQKQEQIINTMTQDLRAANEKLAITEVRAENLKREKELLKMTENRLTQERDSLIVEQRGQNLLLTNLQAIQVTLERSDAEIRQRYTNQIEKLEQELIQIKKKLEHEIEQKHMAGKNRDVQMLDLKRQYESEVNLHNSTKELLKNSHKEISTLKQQLGNFEAQLASRSSQLSSSKDTDDKGEDIEEIKNKLRQSEELVGDLKERLKTAISNVEQYKEVVLGLEESLNKEKQVTEEARKTIEIRMKEAAEYQGQLEKKMMEAEKEKQELRDEKHKAVESTEQQLSQLRQSLSTVQGEVKSALQRATTATNNEQKARQDCQEQARIAAEAQNKYERELMLHAADVEALQAAKEQLSKGSATRQKTEQAARKAEAELLESKASWEERERMLKAVSSFHLNEEIILPSFCLAPIHRIEKALHTLDVVRALRREWLGEKDFTIPGHSSPMCSRSRHSPSFLGARSVHDSEYESDVSLDPDAPEFKSTVDSLIEAVNHVLKQSILIQSCRLFQIGPIRSLRQRRSSLFQAKSVLARKAQATQNQRVQACQIPFAMTRELFQSTPPKSTSFSASLALRRPQQMGQGSGVVWLQNRVPCSPPARFFPSRLPSLGAQSRALLCAIRSLRQSGVIVPVPEHERFRGFYSNLFVVPKRDGKLRPILDLKLLNKYVKVRHFRMESLRSVISSMERGEYLASIGIKDAYLHIPIFPPHQRFLRFAILEDHFQFTALPFGLATAPRVFTKVMAILHSRGVVVLPYLDDLLIKVRFGFRFGAEFPQRFVRREKEIAETRFEVAQVECLRYRQRIEHMEKEINELQDSLNAEREKVQVGIVQNVHYRKSYLLYETCYGKVTAKTMAQHDELMRKTETMNVIIETNRLLREEKEKLDQDLQQLQAKIRKLEANILPLQESNSELSEKSGMLQAEKKLLEEDVKRWRARTQHLLNQQKDTDVEEYKKLLSEREINTKRVQQLTEDTGKLKTEIARYLHTQRRCSDTDNDVDRCSVAVWSLESCHTGSYPATNDAEVPW